MPGEDVSTTGGKSQLFAWYELHRAAPPAPAAASAAFMVASESAPQAPSAHVPPAAAQVTVQVSYAAVASTQPSHPVTAAFMVRAPPQLLLHEVWPAPN